MENTTSSTPDNDSTPSYTSVETSTPPSDPLSKGAIAGIAVGATVFVIFVIVLTLCLVCRKSKGRKAQRMCRGTGDMLRVFRETFLRRVDSQGNNPPSVDIEDQADIGVDNTELSQEQSEKQPSAQDLSDLEPPKRDPIRLKNSPKQEANTEGDTTQDGLGLPTPSVGPPQPHKNINTPGYLKMGGKSQAKERKPVADKVKDTEKKLDTANREIPLPPTGVRVLENPPSNAPTPHTNKKTTPYVNSQIENNIHNPDEISDDEYENQEVWTSRADVRNNGQPEINKSPAPAPRSTAQPVSPSTDNTRGLGLKQSVPITGPVDPDAGGIYQNTDNLVKPRYQNLTSIGEGKPKPGYVNLNDLEKSSHSIRKH